MQHGKQYAYRIGKCRCEACRAWYNQQSRDYRQRRKARTGERIVRGKFIRDPPSDDPPASSD